MHVNAAPGEAGSGLLFLNTEFAVDTLVDTVNWNAGKNAVEKKAMQDHSDSDSGKYLNGD